MRIGVVGAAGQMGTKLVEAIVSAPGLELAACIVSPGSRHAGRPVAGGGIAYRAGDAAINARCDVMIDFSTPRSTMMFQELCAEKPIPFVIGTTGLSHRDMKALARHARHRPMVQSENYAAGSLAFEQAATLIAGAAPGARAQRSDVRRLRRDAGGLSDMRPSMIARPADVTEYSFDAGGVEITLTYRVSTLAAYVDGALAAAHWLVDSGPTSGLHTLADTIRDKSRTRDDRP
ncbi:dihydrodipicolinate reductase [Mesorhizobium sp. CAU 1741]|uniref:dihydrodipicolinate reductase n=1 Tax=Mesorhizobium sp. CAU 1741 TaxID=3140366 RepID=UPI00325C1FDE